MQIYGRQVGCDNQGLGHEMSYRRYVREAKLDFSTLAAHEHDLLLKSKGYMHAHIKVSSTWKDSKLMNVRTE